jgi:hypothetical protein
VAEISMDHPFIDSDEPASDETDDFDEPHHRRKWPTVVVSLVVVVLVIGAALYEAASHYQPLAQSLNGGYGAQVLTSSGALADSPSAAWTEPSGSFRVEVIVTLNNDQRFGVTINNVLAPANPSGTSNVHAYFDSKGNGQGVYGYKGGPAFKPTTLASKGQLQLVVHWSQQCVPVSAQSEATTYTSVPVEYTFIGFHHTVNVPIQRLTITPRTTC